VAELPPVVVKVTRIREELHRAVTSQKDRNGDAGQPSTARLGWIFHNSFASLMSFGSKESWRKLSPDVLQEPGRLRQHVYSSSIGPLLQRNKAKIGGATSQLLAFWQAVSEMCEWTRGMIEAAKAAGLAEYDEARKEWKTAAGLITTEQPLSWELSLSGWSRPVRVVGTADAVWRKPQSGDWCLVEYKLGLTSPEADLCQACLYYEMLRASAEDKTAGSLAMLRFLPQLKETFYPAKDLVRCRDWLIQLIGSIAGVAARPPAYGAPRSGEPSEDAEPSIVEQEQKIMAERDDGQPKSDELGQHLLRVLEEFGSPAVMEAKPFVGPTFIRYVLQPMKGVTAHRILRQNLDLQVRLRLDAAPMIHVHEGRLVVDLQRRDRQKVLFSSIEDQLPAPNESGSAKVPVGVNLEGKLRFADLSNPVNSHILVAGTAGSGKSEWLRSAIAGLLLTNTPETLRLVLIDPKRNAFSDLKDSPFLYSENSIVYPPEHSVTDVLRILIDEMERRYQDFEKHGADDLGRYILKTGDRSKPRIVCVCDEYADLVTANRAVRREIESSISRLGAKARAAGIHLILATQRPSREVIVGVLRANMSCKVGLRTQSSIESRIILEDSGTEKLLGNGDLLFCDIGKPVRLQSPYLPEEERTAIFQSRRR